MRCLSRGRGDAEAARGFLGPRARGGSIAAGALAAGSERRRRRPGRRRRGAQFLSRFSMGGRHGGFGRDWLGIRVGEPSPIQLRGFSPVFEVRRATTAAATRRCSRRGCGSTAGVSAIPLPARPEAGWLTEGREGVERVGHSWQPPPCRMRPNRDVGEPIGPSRRGCTGYIIQRCSALSCCRPAATPSDPRGACRPHGPDDEAWISVGSDGFDLRVCGPPHRLVDLLYGRVELGLG